MVVTEDDRDTRWPIKLKGIKVIWYEIRHCVCVCMGRLSHPIPSPKWCLLVQLRSQLRWGPLLTFLSFGVGIELFISCTLYLVARSSATVVRWGTRDEWWLDYDGLTKRATDQNSLNDGLSVRQVAMPPMEWHLARILNRKLCKFHWGHHPD